MRAKDATPNLLLVMKYIEIASHHMDNPPQRVVDSAIYEDVPHGAKGETVAPLVFPSSAYTGQHDTAMEPSVQYHTLLLVRMHNISDDTSQQSSESLIVLCHHIHLEYMLVTLRRTCT